MTSIHKLYEPTQPGEENAVDLVIEADMTVDDVAQKVMELTKHLDETVETKSMILTEESKPATSSKGTKVCDIL